MNQVAIKVTFDDFAANDKITFKDSIPYAFEGNESAFAWL